MAIGGTVDDFDRDAFRLNMASLLRVSPSEVQLLSVTAGVQRRAPSNPTMLSHHDWHLYSPLAESCSSTAVVHLPSCLC